MAMIRNGKVYRNLEEQVLKNMEDIEELSQHQGTEVVANPDRSLMLFTKYRLMTLFGVISKAILMIN